MGRGKYSLSFDERVAELVSRVDIVYFASSFWMLIPFVKRLGKPSFKAVKLMLKTLVDIDIKLIIPFG